jgi:hypothetical protein
MCKALGIWDIRYNPAKVVAGPESPGDSMVP